MSDVSEEALLEFFCSSGGASGRLRNAELLRTFKPFIGHPEPQLRGRWTEQGTGEEKEKKKREEKGEKRVKW